MQNIRMLVPDTVLLLAALLLAGCASMPAGPLPASVEQVGERAYLFEHGDQRSLFVVGDDGVIVTDPLNSAAAAEYRAAIAKITDRPVLYVVYSHYHWDRILGAEVFTREGARVVAQERCAERFRDNPNPRVMMPDRSFGDRDRLDAGGATLDLYYFGPSHGDCLTVFLARPARVMQVVELVEPPAAMFPADPIVPYIRPHNLDRFFEAAARLAADEGIASVVSSHAREIGDGAGGTRRTPVTAPAAIIAEQGAFWSAVRAGVDEAYADGHVGIDGMVRIRKIDLTPFESILGYRRDELPVVMRRFVGFHDMGR